jgi:signal transduction histidine kinase/ligand-binding sensor domain-containing protein/DNA-binding response OmpR family regulator
MVYLRTKLLVFLLLLSFFFEAHAQFNEYNFEKINIEIDGDKVYDVHLMAQDHQGYIWMGTNLGLIRYDGIEAKNYRSDSFRSGSNDERVLYVDSQGILWIGANSGLSKYIPDCDCLYKFPAIDYKNSLTGVTSITEDQNQRIWILTRAGNIFQYDREIDSFTQMFHKASDSLSLVNKNVNHLLADQTNNLWIGTSQGLIQYNISTGKAKHFSHNPSDPHSLLSNRISTLYEDQQGRILIGTRKAGFHIYNPKDESLSRISYDPNNPNQIHAPYSEESVFGNDPFVNIIHHDQNGGYWIGTSGKGINHFNARTNTFNNYNFNLVNPQMLVSIFEDKQGNLWVGGRLGGGLYKTDLYGPKHYLNTSFSNVEAAYESPLNPGILWIKSQETALSRMNLQTNEIKNYRHNQANAKSIGNNWVRSIYQENKNTLWVGLGVGGAYNQVGNGGIDRMDIESEIFTHFKLTSNDDGLDDFSYTPYTICEDKEGYLWLGAGPGGIFRSDKEKKAFKPFKNFKNDTRSEEVFLNITRIDSNGDVWASDFAGEGTLYLYDREQNMFNPFLRGFKMYNLLVDEKGWLLISTWEKGLVHLNPVDKSYIQYTKKDGLPSNEGVDITNGDPGIYWVSTRIGPAKFNNKTGEISPAGLPKLRYNTGIFKASDNQLYVGAAKGLYSFHPSQIGGNPYPPQTDISELLISNTNYFSGNSKQQELTLTHNQNDLVFKYVGLHYSDPKNNVYQYKLNPIDEEWINAGNQRSVRFANLSPGTYDFEVKASNSDGVWSDEIASVQFTIKSPWYATNLAYLLYATFLIFLADRFYRFQLSRKIAASESERLKEINQLKNTLFTNITHEFRTPLTVIKGMTDSIKSNLQTNKQDGLEKSLDMIERNSDNLMRLVNEMLDLAKIESGNMELQLAQSDVIPFLKYLSESFSSFAEENQISLTVYSEIDSLLMDFDANKLTSIISNLLSNAIKFTSKLGKIIVHINRVEHYEKDCLLIKVKDSGIGIAEEELQNIFSRFYQADNSTIRKSEGTGIGLALTKELVDLMHGTIEVKSVLDKGSEFNVFIPISRKATVSKHIQVAKMAHHPISKQPTEISSDTVESQSDLPLLLIIEDNVDVAHYLKTCLKNKYETLHAINGIDGIEMALEKIPDIIISDVMMPGKDGFEVCETLKTDERTDHIPIIMLTAKASIEDRITGLARGADAYLAKPFNKEELFTRLDQLLNVRAKLINKIQKEGFNTLLKKRTKDPKLQFLQKIGKLIHKDISNSEFGSEDLAKQLLISESQVYRKIKAITGKSTAVYIRSIRLKYAKGLLKHSEKTVSEVAYEVGFNDPSWFSRVFKEEFGYSPSSTSK